MSQTLANLESDNNQILRGKSVILASDTFRFKNLMTLGKVSCMCGGEIRTAGMFSKSDEESQVNSWAMSGVL